jgi:hypothetical protein
MGLQAEVLHSQTKIEHEPSMEFCNGITLFVTGSADIGAADDERRDLQ